MHITNFEIFMIFMIFFMLVFIGFYVWFFYTTIIKKDVYRQFVRQFHNAIVNISKKDLTNEDAFLQLKLNYEKLSQERTSSFTSILDLLETIIYYYDTYPDEKFTNIFRIKKEEENRDFIMDICSYLKATNPFISSPLKEGELMRTLKDALENDNPSLGENALLQLSREIETKEKLLTKKDKENQRANVISIVGIILTLFFGFLSFWRF